MSSQIIEFSSFNSKQINEDNSRWSNKFNSVIVNSSDITQMKSAFIDTNQADTFGEITIDTDISLDLEFGYYINYVNDYSLVAYIDGNPPTLDATYVPNNEPHIARSKHVVSGVATYAPIIGRKTIDISAGTYPPSVLGKKISVAHSSVPNISLTQFKSNPNEFLRPNNGNNELNCKNIPITNKGQKISAFFHYIYAC